MFAMLSSTPPASTSPLLQTVSPEILSAIIAYLSSPIDFGTFTSSCRSLRHYFTGIQWATCLLTEFGSNDVLAQPKSYRRAFLDFNNCTSISTSNPKRADTSAHRFQPVEVVKKLVSWGCNIHVEVDAMSDFPLFFGAAMRDTELIRSCRDRGAKDRHGWLLSCVASWGWVDVLECLDVRADHPQPSHLCYAVHFGHVDAVEYLLEHNPVTESEITNHFAVDNLLTLGLRHGVPMVEVLIRRGVVDLDADDGVYADTEDRYEILRQAIELGDRDLVEFLLEKGVRPDDWDEWRFDRRPELGELALENGNAEIYKTLVQVGRYDISRTRYWFWSAIHNHDPRMLRAVLDVGVIDFFGRDSDDDGAHILSLVIADKAQGEILSVLADSGILDLDNRKYANHKTLKKAIKLRNKDAVALLLKNGVSARIDSGPDACVDDMGLMALKEKRIDIYRMLVDLGGYDPGRMRMWFDHCIKTNDTRLLSVIFEGGITAEDLTGEKKEVVDEMAKTREPTVDEKAYLFKNISALSPRVAKQLVRMLGCPEELITKMVQHGQAQILEVLLYVKGHEAGLGGPVTSGKPLLGNKSVAARGGPFTSRKLLSNGETESTDHDFQQIRRTLLSTAIDCGEAGILDILVREGLKIDDILKDGDDLHGILCSAISWDLFDLIKDLLISPSVTEAARKSLNESLLGVVSPLLQLGGYLRHNRPRTLRRLLHRVLQSRPYSNGKLLLASGVNVDCGRGQGLIAAAKEGRSEVVELLLKAGADVGLLKGMDVDEVLRQGAGDLKADYEHIRNVLWGDWSGGSETDEEDEEEEAAKEEEEDDSKSKHKEENSEDNEENEDEWFSEGESEDMCAECGCCHYDGEEKEEEEDEFESKHREENSEDNAEDEDEWVSEGELEDVCTECGCCHYDGEEQDNEEDEENWG
ncbi:hypothetical protein HK102_007139 [Quaeritorhiza haematococci]|nr:hypothetical protein HK102_007139 [Quaeritorhiza haematococci]